VSKEVTILTLHPHGKNGRAIDKGKYETVKKAMISLLEAEELTHTELFERLNRVLRGHFDGNISWFGETVKLDLEARRIIERFGGKSAPQEA
jgi:hypothetical protein